VPRDARPVITASPVLALGARSGCNSLDPSNSHSVQLHGNPKQWATLRRYRDHSILRCHLEIERSGYYIYSLVLRRRSFNAGLSSLRLIRVHPMKLYRTAGPVILQASSSMDIKSASPRISNTRSVKCGSARRRECSGRTPSASTNLAS
jgi:hypothetical protein